MAQARSSCSRQAGFSLVEVLVSMTILTAVSLGVAQLFAASTRVNLLARAQTSTTMLAEQKIEQIRSLTWASSPEGIAVSDTISDLTVYPTTASGSGLSVSPADSLEQNTAGFVDFVDAGGTWVGTGTTQPPTAHYVRRWSIRSLPSNPNTLVIMVLVTPTSNEAARLATWEPRMRMPGDTLLMTVKTRKSS